MSDTNGIREERLWHALLDGHTCKAVAWVQATSLDVLDGKGQVRRVPGVRRWRGRALIDRDAFPSDFPASRAVRYAGKVLDGDQEREINADVFLLFTHREPAVNGNGVCDGQTYVEFIGAETPFKSTV
jgi:hypothetical protein